MFKQEDLFYRNDESQREQLVFQASLRMDRHIPSEQRMKRVEEVMMQMSLWECRDTLIGIPGRIKGISGGETKRLAFACEVLTDPPLLFCDEPTTGLDSFMAQTIVSAMKDLSSMGKTIISTIHQPSSEVFALFDRVLLLSEGRLAYLGLTSDALKFFSGMGKTCPLNYNPADFFISTLAIKPGEEEESLAFTREICDTFEKSEDMRAIEEAAKNNMTSSDNVQEDDLKKTFCEQIPIFLREHLSGMYRCDTFFITKNIAELPMAIFMPFLFTAICYFLVNLNRDASAFFTITGVMILCGNVGYSFGGTIPPYFIWLRYISWFNYGFEALAIAQWKDITDIQCDVPYTCEPTGVKVIEDLGYDPDNLGFDFALLIVLLVAYRFLAYLLLLRRAYVGL
ncbi:Protein white [Armadillidium vulgare]|nr:Protein white [Armadillidium vulgare]